MLYVITETKNFPPPARFTGPWLPMSCLLVKLAARWHWMATLSFDNLGVRKIHYMTHGFLSFSSVTLKPPPWNHKWGGLESSG